VRGSDHTARVHERRLPEARLVLARCRRGGVGLQSRTGVCSPPSWHRPTLFPLMMIGLPPQLGYTAAATQRQTLHFLDDTLG
jgi:hypothetical protein